MGIDVVPIAANHIEGFRAVLDLVANERRYLAMTEAPPLESVRDFVLANIDKGNPHVVAIDHGRVVGWCDITRKSRGVLQHSGVLGMGLLPSHRGLGIGKRLLARALASAWSSAFTRVELTVYEENAAAIALYESLGFEREGLMRNYALIDGLYRHAFLMAIIDPEGARRAVPA